MASPVARGEQRRALIIAGVGLSLVGLLLVGSRLLGGGGGPEEPVTAPTTAPGTTTTTTARAVPTAPGEAEAVPIPDLPDSFELLELRDPFESPLLAAAARPQPRLRVPGAPTPEEGEVEPRARVRLVEIERDDQGDLVGTFEVDGRRFRAGIGERFGPEDEFEVLSLDVEDDCALLRRGDEPFTVCVGEVTFLK